MDKTIWGIGHYSNYQGFESIRRETNKQHIFISIHGCLIPLCSKRIYTSMSFDDSIEKCRDCEKLSKNYNPDEIQQIEIGD